MVERVSALPAHPVPGRLGTPGVTGLVLAEVVDVALTEFNAWPETLSIAAAAIAQHAGCPVAPGPGQSAQGSYGRLLRVEPLKWWLVGRVPGPDVGTQAAEACSVLDLSHARCWLQISGPAAPALLDHYLPLDLRAAAFPEGRVACSAIHHVGVTLWRETDSFGLLIPRSFATSIWELLLETGAQYGIDIRVPD